MSEDISIKVSIGGRKYPLTVAVKDEAMVQNIAADLDKTITSLKENYAVQDKQDLIAMAALQVAVKQAAKGSSSAESSVDSDLLSSLERLVHKSEGLV
ncbi:MAG TPA: cell division protein ZapA [Flavobacteriales bacterium]|nr:cell division protein ZapA [Flavobacteriales bacterium]|tara:strand:+ start:38812 stop:39105 length:294 start_codon:yes stop_codon:yes gene_type:complete